MTAEEAMTLVRITMQEAIDNENNPCNKSELIQALAVLEKKMKQTVI